MQSSAGLTLAYLVSAMLFIFGIKLLGSPATARRGNWCAGLGMLFALAITLIHLNIMEWWLIAIAGTIGLIAGAVSARAVPMTAMPQMVALFNGMGAGAAALIGTSEFRDFFQNSASGKLGYAQSIPIVLSCFIGCVSFSGSLIAFGKLQELITGRAVTYPLQQVLNGLLLASIVAIAVAIAVVGTNDMEMWFAVFLAASLLLGVLFVIPIGGADMPVIISLLNSFTGTAAAVTGFVLSNDILIVSGALVGASGAILTQLMSKAMNRSLFNVLFGAFGATIQGSGPGAVSATDRPVRSATAEDVAVLLAYAQQVVIVPGYGMAVARAQHDVRELADQLQKRGVTVKYAIHPVAGRMPGHMNVLLAEADVPYPQLFEMDDINPEFSRTDVAVVIGANDVVNPAARNDPSSPIYGMPILNVDEAKNIVVLKRSMSPGFAGIDNELFYNPKTVMLFGDARQSVLNLIAEVKKQG